MLIVIWLLVLILFGLWTALMWAGHSALVLASTMPWEQVLVKIQQWSVPESVGPWLQHLMNMLIPLLQQLQALLPQIGGWILAIVVVIWIAGGLLLALIAVILSAIIWAVRKSAPAASV